MPGLQVVWLRGPRTFVTARDNKGRTTTITGKNGGPVIKQEVVKCLIPKHRKEG